MFLKKKIEDKIEEHDHKISSTKTNGVQISHHSALRKSILSFSSLSTSLNRSKRKVKIPSNVLCEPEIISVDQIYTDAIWENRATRVRHLTPISQISDRKLPSPRERDNSNDMRIESSDVKTQENIHRRWYKKFDFNTIIGSELDVLSKKKRKAETFKPNCTVPEKYFKLNVNRPKFRVNNSKAKRNDNGGSNTITVSHLSPNREDLKRCGPNTINYKIDVLSSKRHSQRCIKKLNILLEVTQSQSKGVKLQSLKQGRATRNGKNNFSEHNMKRRQYASQ